MLDSVDAAWLSSLGSNLELGIEARLLTSCWSNKCLSVLSGGLTALTTLMHLLDLHLVADDQVAVVTAVGIVNLNMHVSHLSSKVE